MRPVEKVISFYRDTAPQKPPTEGGRDIVVKEIIGKLKASR
jgi:hypothetical protein